MQTTSHFVLIELKSEIFSDLYKNIFDYLKQNNIENILSFQNILSVHITLYYFEKNLNINSISKINKIIKIIKLDDIFINWFKYFYRDNKEFLLYIDSFSKKDLKNYRDLFHKNFKRDFIIDNTFEFIPHITFFKIIDIYKFQAHKQNIENIILSFLENIKNKNITTKNIFIYKVNSSFKEEIQIKI